MTPETPTTIPAEVNDANEALQTAVTQDVLVSTMTSLLPPAGSPASDKDYYGMSRAASRDTAAPAAEE